MRTTSIIRAVALLGFLSACGAPAVSDESAVPSPARPTAAVIPTVSPSPEIGLKGDEATDPVVPAETEPATPTLVPPAAEAPAPTAVVPDAVPEPLPPANEPDESQIVIDAPQAGELISSPVTVSGSTNFWPFEANLAVQLKDAAGNVLGMMGVMVQSPDVGQGGPWSDQLSFTAPTSEQEGTLEVFEASAKDGSILTIASVKVRLAPAPEAGVELEQPEADSAVTLPLHVALGGARGDEQLVLRLQLADGTMLTHETRAILGYVVDTIPGTGAAGPATLEVARPDGTVLARRAVRVAGLEESQRIQVAWAVEGSAETTLQSRLVPATSQIGTAALQELLWGPVEDDAGYTTSLPTPAEVLTYSGRTEEWGARVRLLKLTITDGVALADFSKELRAYGGGAARVDMIRKQIEQTLFQFPSVSQVVIAIEGQTEGVLEP